MNTIMHRRRGSRMSLSIYKRYELLTGRIEPMVNAYDGYATTGNRTNLADYISDQMRADWAANRALLVAYWHSGQSEVEFFSPDDVLPWLYLHRRPGALPWAVKHLD